MARPVTLFTGQWADLPLEDMCRKASDFGYQGLELACWGDHFEVNKATLEKIVYGGEVFVKVGDLTFYPTQGFQLLLYNILQVAE